MPRISSGIADVRPGAHDEVDHGQFDGGHAHEHDQDGEHRLVVAEPDRARRNPGSPEDEPEDALVAADLQHGGSAREVADESPTGSLSLPGGRGVHVGPGAADRLAASTRPSSRSATRSRDRLNCSSSSSTEVGHQLSGGLLAVCRHVGHRPAAEFGQRDQQGAPVRRMRTTLHESAGLQGIDQAGHVAGADLEGGRQRLLGRRSDLMELPEEMRPGRREPGPGEGGRHVLLDQQGDLQQPVEDMQLSGHIVMLLHSVVTTRNDDCGPTTGPVRGSQWRRFGG